MLTPYYEAEGVTVYHADCRTVCAALEPASIDFIFTDPVYVQGGLYTYSDLAVGAVRVAKPGAFVYAYVGAHYLPEAISRMAPYLTWFWLFNVRHGGANPRVWSKRLMVMSKPVMVWTHGPVAQGILRWCGTDGTSTGREKQFHRWQQSIAWAEKQILLRTSPGDLVFDPFMGGGTTARAALNLRRRVITCDTDERMCQAVGVRLAQGVFDLDIDETSAPT